MTGQRDASEPPPVDEGVSATIVHLVDDAKDYARAQADLWKATAAARMRSVRNAALLGGGAIVLVLSAVVALLVGLIVALAPLVGGFAATGIVVIVTLAVAGLLGWLAVGAARRMTEPLE